MNEKVLDAKIKRYFYDYIDNVLAIPYFNAFFPNVLSKVYIKNREVLHNPDIIKFIETGEKYDKYKEEIFDIIETIKLNLLDLEELLIYRDIVNNMFSSHPKVIPYGNNNIIVRIFLYSKVTSKEVKRNNTLILKYVLFFLNIKGYKNVMPVREFLTSDHILEFKYVAKAKQVV